MKDLYGFDEFVNENYSGTLLEKMDVSDDLKKVNTLDEFKAATKGKYLIIQSKHSPTDMKRRGGAWPAVWFVWDTDKPKSTFFNITAYPSMLSLGYFARETSGYYAQPTEMLYAFFMFNKKRGNKIYTSDKMPLKDKLGPIYDKISSNMATVREILNNTSLVYDPSANKKISFRNQVASYDGNSHGSRIYEYTVKGVGYTAYYNVYSHTTKTERDRSIVYPDIWSRSFKLYNVDSKLQKTLGDIFTENESEEVNAIKILNAYWKSQDVKVK